MARPIATAIVSTWSAERFIRGCLDDLLQQTIGDALEILVVDACSPQADGEIARDYAARHANVKYVRAERRLNTSEAFDLATSIATGEYLTTANTDDRHRRDFFEVMAKVLDEHPEFGLVYADSLITERENETFAENTADRRYEWPDFSMPLALSCCLFGAQPVWRRSAHERAGTWDHGLVRANDHDMFLRIAWRTGAVHLRESMGLFLARPDSVSGASNRRRTLGEILRVMRRYRSSIPLEDIFPGLPADREARASALFEMGNLCARGPYTDAAMALDFWRRGMEAAAGSRVEGEARRVFANGSACVLAAIGRPRDAVLALGHARGLPEADRNAAAIEASRSDPGPLPLAAFSFAELPHPAVLAARRTTGLRIGAGGNLAFGPMLERAPWEVFDGPNGVPIGPERPRGGAGKAMPARASIPLAVPPRAASAREPAPRLMLVMYGWNDSGGGTILPRAAAAELARRGHEVAAFLASPAPDPAMPPYGVRRWTEDGVDLTAVCNRESPFLDLGEPEREIDDPRVRAPFEAALDEFRPDVVHFFNLHNLGLSLPGACRARGIPTAFSPNNYWPICPRLYLFGDDFAPCRGPDPSGSKCARCVGNPGKAAGHAARLARAIEVLDREVDAHLSVSRRVREIYARAGCDSSRIRVLLQAPPMADRIWEEAGGKRQIVEWLARPLRVGFVGSCLPHKGVQVLARALQGMPARSVEAVAVGDAHPAFADSIRRLDPERRLHFCGGYPQAALPRLLSKLDVVVVPSVWEDCAPLVVAEALAARCPVLGSRIGGIEDFVVHGRNGFLFEPGDADGLRSLLLRFAADPRLLGRLQRGIRAPAGFGAYVDELCSVYGSLSRRGGQVPVRSRGRGALKEGARTVDETGKCESRTRVSAASRC